MCGEEEKKREEETMKESREEAELPFHLINNRSKPDFWASSSCCSEIPQCEDCCFMVHKGSSATSHMGTVPKSSLSQITACL